MAAIYIPFTPISDIKFARLVGEGDQYIGFSGESVILNGATDFYNTFWGLEPGASVSYDITSSLSFSVSGTSTRNEEAHMISLQIFVDGKEEYQTSVILANVYHRGLYFSMAQDESRWYLVPIWHYTENGMSNSMYGAEYSGVAYPGILKSIFADYPFEGLVDDGNDTPDTPSDEEDEPNYDDYEFEFIESLNLTPTFRYPKYIGDRHFRYGDGFSWGFSDFESNFDASNCVDVFEYAERVLNGEEFEFVAPNGTSKLRIYNDNNETVSFTCVYGENEVDITTLNIKSLESMLPQLRETYSGYIGFVRLADMVGVYQLTHNLEGLNAIEFVSTQGLTEWYESLGDVEDGGNDTPSNPPTESDDPVDIDPPSPPRYEDYTTAELFFENVDHQIIITDGSIEVSEGKIIISGDTVTITNEEIDGENFSLSESICTEEDIDFGACNASECSFTTLNMRTPLLGKKLKVYMYLNNRADTLYQFGEYIVNSDKPTADRTRRDVVMYDALYALNSADVTAWYNRMLPTTSSAVTLRALRSSLLTEFGITEDYPAEMMPNDTVAIKRAINPTTLSGADVIRAMCQMNGCFGHIGRNGHFQSIYLPQSIEGRYPSVNLYPREDLYPRDANSTLIAQSAYFPPLVYEDYMVEGITQLEIRKSDDTIGTAVGTPGNAYIIQGNFLLYGKSSTELTSIGNNILGKIEKIIYRPFETRAIGYPLIEVGNSIRCNTSTQRIESYVLQRTLSGVQSLKDSYISLGNKQRDEKVNSVSTQIASLNGVISTQIQALSDGLAISIDEDGNIVTSAEIKASGIDFKANKFCVDSTNFTLNEDGDAWFGGKVESQKVEGGVLEITTIDGGIFTQRHLGGGLERITEIKEGAIEVYDGLGTSPKAYFNINGLYAPRVVADAISTDEINGGTPITSENIGSQTVSSASYAYNSSVAESAQVLRSESNIFQQVYINSYGNFVPLQSGTMRCGGSQGKWSEVWAENGTIQTSDRNLKHDIEDIDERYVEFITKLMPKRFKMNSGTSGRYHMGFIAQDVEDLLTECGIESIEFAGLIKDVYKDDDGNDVEYYALRYSEFIAPLIAAWQRTEDKLNKLIDLLKEREVI